MLHRFCYWLLTVQKHLWQLPSSWPTVGVNSILRHPLHTNVIIFHTNKPSLFLKLFSKTSVCFQIFRCLTRPQSASCTSYCLQTFQKNFMVWSLHLSCNFSEKFYKSYIKTVNFSCPLWSANIWVLYFLTYWIMEENVHLWDFRGSRTRVQSWNIKLLITKCVHMYTKMKRWFIFPKNMFLVPVPEYLPVKIVQLVSSASVVHIFSTQ